jgi:hypothetical protein
MPLGRGSGLIRRRRHGTLVLVLSALVLGAAAVVPGCRETSSVVSPDPPPSVVSPDPAACTFEVAPATQIINNGLGGSGTVIVATTSTCAWTATTDGGWITLAAPTSGNGNGTVNFAAAYNPGPERRGSVIINGQPSTITQGGTVRTAMPCTYTIDPSSQTIGAAGGAGPGVQVYTSYGCEWIATSNAPWISVTWGGSGGAGFAVVTFSVAANMGDARTGTLTIAGHIVTISQAAAGAPPPPPPPPAACWYTISPTSNGIMGIGGGGHTVTVTTASTCAWTATSNDAWITITSGASGTGNGVVTYRVAGNNGPARRGTLTIAGLTATVPQGEGRLGPLPR